jgi:beta-glucanase (GH16 family)
MKKIINIFSALLITIILPCAVAQAADEGGTGREGGYSLVWQDTFDGSILDETNNWSIEVNGDGGGNSELQYYRKENIAVGKEPDSGVSSLIITGKKESYLGKTCTSGRLTTQNKMSFKYGKLEARIKLPKTANGLWPAFWLLGTDMPTVGWPRCAEIDVLVMGAATGITKGTQEKYFGGACHWGYYEDGWYPNYAKATTNSYSLQDDFHLFTMVWDPQSIKLYLDWDKYPTASPYYAMDITSNTSDKDVANYFHKQFFVIFNLAIGGNFPQIWNIDNVTALNNGDVKMYVDYVKVYQKGDTGEEYSGPAVTGITSGKTDTNLRHCVYPNPVTDNLRIEGGNLPKRISFFNIAGQDVLDASNDDLVDTSALPAGNYILKIEDADGLIEVHQVVKNK